METLPIVSQNELSVSAQAAGAIAEIQAAYAMAIQRPRDISRARLRILEDCERLRFAEAAKWVRPVGKDKEGNQVFAEGISIRGAEALQRAFGNILVRSDTLYDDDRQRKISVTVVDLESNTSQMLSGVISKTTERRHNPKWDVTKGREIIGERFNSSNEKIYILRAFDHEIELQVGALRSKLMRDCLLRLIPADIREEMEDKINQTLDSDAKVDPVTARKRLVDAYLSMGIRPEQLAEYLRHPVETVTSAELVTLRKMYETIKAGEATWESFQPIDVTPKAETQTMRMADAKAAEEPPPPVQDEPVPESREPTASLIWGEFVDYWLDREATREQLNDVQVAALKAFSVKKIVSIKDVSNFQAWLDDEDSGALYLLAQAGVSMREPGEDG